MFSIILSTVGLLIVIALPGVAFSYALSPKWRWWVHAAAGPSIGVTMSFIGVRIATAVDAPLIIGWVIVIATALAALGWRLTRGRLADDDGAVGSGMGLAEILLTAAVVLAAAIWALAFRGVEVPPNWDAVHHALKTARIVLEGTVDPNVVNAALVTQASSFSEFYPLGLHAATATVHTMFGTTIADIWLTVTALAGAILWPIGIFAFTRTLFPDRPHISGYAALASVLVALFPYKPVAWGGIPLIAGMGLALGAAIALHLATSQKLRWTTTTLVVLAVAGTGISHTSELPVILGLAFVLWMEPVLRGNRTGAWASLARTILLLGVGGVLVVALEPNIVSLATSGPDPSAAPTERVTVVLERLVDLTPFTGVGAPLISLAALAGVVIALIRRRGLSLVLGAAVVVAGYVATSSATNPLVLLPTAPFYGQAERVVYLLFYFVPPLAALAVAGAVDLLPRRLSARWTTAVALVFAIGLVLGAGATRLPAFVEGYTYWYSPVGLDEVAAMEWLEGNAPAGSRVLTDQRKGGSWLYAFTGIDPVILVDLLTSDTAGLPGDAKYEYDKSVWLRAALPNARHEDVRSALEELSIDYVFLGSRTIGITEEGIEAERLAVDPLFESVFSRNGANVYRLNWDAVDRASDNILQDGSFGSGFDHWYPDDAGAWSLADEDGGVCALVQDTDRSVLYETATTEPGARMTHDRVAVFPGESVLGEIGAIADRRTEATVWIGGNFYDLAGDLIATQQAAVIDLPGQGIASGSMTVPNGAVWMEPVIVAADVHGGACINAASLRLSFPSS